MPVLIAINVWKLFPFVAIMVLAGLQAIPADLYEAAKVDGASFWQEVRFVTLPQVRPVITAVTLLLVIWGLNSITIIYAITGGGPANRTLITPIQIFKLAFESFQFNQAAALSVIFFVVGGDHRRDLSENAADYRRGKRDEQEACSRPSIIAVVIDCACAGLPLPLRLDGAVVDQGPAGALYRAAALAARRADDRQLRRR